MSTLLNIENLNVSYGDFQALFDLNLQVNNGEILAIVGANGAGKSTLMRTICRAHVSGVVGTLERANHSIVDNSASAAARDGVILVPEGRQLFPSLSVEENLCIGASTERDGPWQLETVLDLFPDLRKFLSTPATQLSGGQQQMVAIGRALMGNPELLLCDEVSLGLAPGVIDQMYETLAIIRQRGTAMVVVEQNIAKAIEISDRVICMRGGKITYEKASMSSHFDEIEQAYFGGEKSNGH